MTCWLKQSTAVDVMLGPFLDSTDGNTVESALTITQPDIRLSKNGGAFAQKSAAQTLTHGENGWYPANLSTTDTNTLGVLIVAVHETGALPVWREFLVVPANVYDSLFSTDLLQVDLTQWLGATPNALVASRVDASVGAMSANSLTAAATATDYLAEINTEVDTAIADARLDELLAADSDIDGAAPPVTGSVFHELMSKSTGSFSFDQTTDSLEAIRDKESDIETDTQDLQSRLPAALVSGRIDSSVGAVAANAITDAAVAADMDAYHAKVWVVKESITADHYAVVFFKNGQPVTTGITSPTIQVIKASDGTDLIASTGLTEVGSLGIYKKDESTNKMGGGAIYFAKVQATIDGSARQWLQQIGRDAA